MSKSEQFIETVKQTNGEQFAYAYSFGVVWSLLTEEQQEQALQLVSRKVTK